MRLFAENFLKGKYADCLEFLNKMKPQLLLDIHFSSCVESVYAAIKDQIFVLSFLPYKTLDMHKLSHTLRMNVIEIESIISKLISKKIIPARIDSQTKTLQRLLQDDRQKTMEKILNLTEKHTREVKRGILRLSLMQHGMIVSRKNSNVSKHNNFHSMQVNEGEISQIEQYQDDDEFEDSDSYREMMIHDEI